jgi:plastocyanin
MRFHSLMPALCAASVLLASGCGSNSSGPSDGGSNPPPDGDILVQNDLYNPSTLTVATGTTVTWAWDSHGAQHTVTFDADPSQTSGTKTSGTYQRTFGSAGTFAFHCEIHPTIMKGTITVTASGSSGDNPPPAQGGGGSGGSGMGGGGYGY